LAVPSLAARAYNNAGGNEEQNDEQAFAASKKMTRTPPKGTLPPSSAPPRISDEIFVFNAAGSKDETPKRGRGLESPSSMHRETPPKKPKNVTTPRVLMRELRDILG